MSDIRVNNDIAIHIHGFETRYHPAPDGSMVERDVVTYSPMGDAKTTVHREIRVLQGVLPEDECGDNIAYLSAARLWAFIAPRYQAWKDGQAIPDTGTPLAAWAGVTAAQAALLKNIGIRTVEDVAGASDIVMTKTQLANAIWLRDQARAFLANADKAKGSAQLTSLQSENDELKAQMQEMMAMMRELTAERAAKDEPKRRGRPPNQPPAEVVDEPAEVAA